MNPTLLEKLLKDVDVEWKPLGEVGELIRGNGLQKKDLIESGVPAIHYGQIYTYYGLFAETTKSYVSHDLAKRLKKAQCGDILIAGTSENVEDVMKPVGWLGGSIVFSGDMFVFRPNYDVDTKYLTYLLTTKYFFDYKRKHVKGTKVIRMNTEKFLEFLVPIPLLSVQKEIVGILDAFTAHTAELTAELNERKKQYNYYLNKLLTFSDDEVEWKTLGDIGEVRMCKRILKHQTSENGDVPFYKIGTFGKRPDAYISRELFNDYKKKYNYPKIGEVLISASGTIGRTVIFDGSDAYFQDSNIVWIENDESQVLNKYLFYYYKIAKWGASEGGTIARLYNDNLRKVAIPIPTLAEQQRIVDILDKFDALTTSITQGLPREIELRQKQYEYYRDQLLNFPKPGNDAIKHNSTNR